MRITTGNSQKPEKWPGFLCFPHIKVRVCFKEWCVQGLMGVGVRRGVWSWSYGGGTEGPRWLTGLHQAGPELLASGPRQSQRWTQTQEMKGFSGSGQHFCEEFVESWWETLRHVSQRIQEINVLVKFQYCYKKEPKQLKKKENILSLLALELT